MPPVVSVVLPTYNERDNIGDLVHRLDGVLSMPYEILVIDDNSPDGTAAAVDHLARELPQVRAIVRSSERGLTSAIQRGIDESTGDIIVWMDCDLSMPPETVPVLVAGLLAGNVDAAIGSRFVSGGSSQAGQEGFLVKLQKALTRRLNQGISRMLDGKFHDWTSGFIAIRTSVIKPIRLQGDHGEYFIRLMANLIAEGIRIEEIPFHTIPRARGRSKTAHSLVGLLRHGFGYLGAFREARRCLR